MSPHLSFDIQLEIIKRFPVKSLIQFRSVCKACKSLIDSSQFIAGYNVRRDQPHHLMIRYEVGYLKEKEVKYVSFVDDDSFPQQKFALTVPPLAQITRSIRYFRGPELYCSSHGLLCLAGYFQGPDIFKGQHMAVLWNPSIRKSIAVALPDVLPNSPFIYVLGFGVCPDTKDPKLVKITYIRNYHKMESISCIPSQVMVFTLSSREWTPSRSNLPRKSIDFTGSQTVISQFIYLLACDCTDAVYDEFHNLIMSFDMSTEEFREVDLPDCLAEMPAEDLFISRLRESLVLLDYRETTDKQVCGVWMMEHGDPKAFTKLFTINLPNASVAWPVAWTLGFRKSGEPIVQMRDDNKYYNTADAHALAVYELCSDHIKGLGICGFRFSGSSYTESLLLMDHEDGHIVRCGAVKS